MMDGGRRRLSAPDATYWFVHDTLHWSVVLQLTWTVEGSVPDAALEEMAARLSAGRLHRRLCRPRVPGARPYWVRAEEPLTAVIDRVPVADDEIDAWSGAELDGVPLDPEEGRCWRLRAVTTRDGRSVLSLTALHLVTDGRSMVAAASDALAAVALGRDIPVRGSADLIAADRIPADTSAAGGRTAGAVADLVDAVRQVGAAASGVARVAVGVGRDRLTEGRAGGGRAQTSKTVEAAPTSTEPGRASLSDRAPTAVGARATATVAADAWEAVAVRHGGTTNSLFVAVVSGTLRSAGHADLGVPIRVGLPVDVRADGDDGGNATAGVTVTLTDQPVAGTDLGPIRRACKHAFTELGAGRRTSTVHLQPLMWLLPNRWLLPMVTAGSGMPDVVASNLGASEGLSSVAGRRASRVAFRGIAQGVDPDLPYRFGDGVQAWFLRSGDSITIAAQAFDEKTFPDDSTLRAALRGELLKWEVPHEIR
ncbi:hypothetical protein [Gordonia soli]|uniref:Condensation domain-containing protein n=1 Tax=Gordonia soli NBRC 108243 TaxID=1223545 RepID=M0QMX8_9ACTN|nr:hypothetical protein [Gordonia soli]GAC69769.1 hypothetical protein GS4_28_00170 [Gordonia soli NBRC 108243]